MNSNTTTLSSVINEQQESNNIPKLLQKRMIRLNKTSSESFGTTSIPLTFTNDQVELGRKEKQRDGSTNDNALKATEVKAIDVEIDKSIADGHACANVHDDDNDGDQREYAFKGRAHAELRSMDDNSRYQCNTLDRYQTSSDVNSDFNLDIQTDVKMPINNEHVNGDTGYDSCLTSISVQQSFIDSIDLPERFDLQNNEQLSLIDPNEPNREHAIDRGFESNIDHINIADTCNNAHQDGQHEEDMCDEMTSMEENIDNSSTPMNDTSNSLPEGSNTTVDHQISTKIPTDSENENEYMSPPTSTSVEQSITDTVDKPEQFDLQKSEQFSLLDLNEPNSEHSIQKPLESNEKDHANIADTSNKADQMGQHEEDICDKMISLEVNIDNSSTPVNDTSNSFPEGSNTTVDHQISNKTPIDSENLKSIDQQERCDLLSNDMLSPKDLEPNAEHLVQECLADNINTDIKYAPINETHDCKLGSAGVGIHNKSIPGNGTRYPSPISSSSNTDSYTDQPEQFDSQYNTRLSPMVPDGPAFECSDQKSVEDNTKGHVNITATSNQTNKEGQREVFVSTESGSMDERIDVESSSMNSESNSSFFETNTKQTSGMLITADDTKKNIGFSPDGRSVGKKTDTPKRYDAQNNKLPSVIPDESIFESSDQRNGRLAPIETNGGHSVQETLEDNKKNHVNTPCKNIQSHQTRQRNDFMYTENSSKAEHFGRKCTRMNGAQNTSVVKSNTDLDSKIKIEVLSDTEDVKEDIGHELRDEPLIDISLQDDSDGNTKYHVSIAKKQADTYKANDSINIRPMNVCMQGDENIKNSNVRGTQVASQAKELNSTPLGDIPKLDYQRCMFELQLEDDPEMFTFAVPFNGMSGICELYQRGLAYRDNQRSRGTRIVSIRDRSVSLRGLPRSFMSGPIVDLHRRIVNLRGSTHVNNTAQANEPLNNSVNTWILPTPVIDQRIPAPTQADPAEGYAGPVANCEVVPTAELIEDVRKCYHCTIRPAVQQPCGHVVCCGDCNNKRGCPQCLV